MNLIKIEPDIERAKSLQKLANLRYKKIKHFNIEQESSLIAESYYEICKELITAILFIDGYKTLSHKELIKYLKKEYNDMSEQEIFILDNLRQKRNKLVYYGVELNSFYITKNKKLIEKIIKKLQEIIKQKIKI